MPPVTKAGTIENSITRRATSAGTPPRPPGSASSVGSEFPEGDHEHYQIDGQPVVSFTLKQLEGGIEKSSAVFIQVADEQVLQTIRNALSRHESLTLNDETPLPFSYLKDKGSYVTDALDRNADLIHDEVRRELEFLAGKQHHAKAQKSVPSVPPMPKGFDADTFRKEMVESEDPHVQKLLEGVFNALTDAYDINSDQAVEAVKKFMQQVWENFEALKVGNEIAKLSRLNTAPVHKAEYLQKNLGLDGCVQEAFEEHILRHQKVASLEEKDQAILVEAEGTFFGSLHIQLKKALTQLIGANAPSVQKGGASLG